MSIAAASASSRSAGSGAELIADRVWQSRAQLELAVVEYLGWFNHTRLHQALGDLPPAEFEARALRAQAAPTLARDRPSTAGLYADR